jgi:hypothetical protein
MALMWMDGVDTNGIAVEANPKIIQPNKARVELFK